MSRFIVSVIIAAILAVGGFFTAGVPGALYGLPADPVIMVVRGRSNSMFVGDQAWGVSLLLTLIVPWAIPIVVGALGFLRPNAPKWQVIAASLLGMYTVTLITLFVMSF